MQSSRPLFQRVYICPQGEQCNIVPDNVDDIVADIAQEEKEEGLVPVSVSLPFSLSNVKNTVDSVKIL